MSIHSYFSSGEKKQILKEAKQFLAREIWSNFWSHLSFKSSDFRSETEKESDFDSERKATVFSFDVLVKSFDLIGGL